MATYKYVYGDLAGTTNSKFRTVCQVEITTGSSVYKYRERYYVEVTTGNFQGTIIQKSSWRDSTFTINGPTNASGDTIKYGVSGWSDYIERTAGQTYTTKEVYASYNPNTSTTYKSTAAATPFTVPSITVTYKSNDGTNGSTEQKAITSGTLQSNTFTRTGYDLVSWNTKADGTGIPYELGATFSSSLTLYAQWKLKTYTVSFDANGGDLANFPSSLTKTHGVNLVLPTEKPRRAGYAFVEWNTNPEGTGAPAVNNTVTGNVSQKLYAIWEESMLTVNYYSGGATSGTLYGEEIQDLTALLGVSEFKYAKEEEYGLWDVQWEKWLYLEKQNYKPTGYWLCGEQRIDQNWPCTGQQLAQSLGLDITYESRAIDVVPEWERAASVITMYDENGQPLKGVVHMYNSSGNLCYGIVTVYNENGVGRLAV